LELGPVRFRPASFMGRADEIRNGLARATERRREARALEAEAASELREWLAEAQSCKGLPMREAAEIVGVSRVMLYKLLG
jgi:F0F1-type ATP synthase membrane subunit b/b'